MSSLSDGLSGTVSPWEKPRNSQIWTERRMGGKDSSCLFPGPTQGKALLGASKTPWATLHGPSPWGLMSTHSGSHLTPALVPSWKKNERLLLPSLESPEGEL